MSSTWSGSPSASTLSSSASSCHTATRCSLSPGQIVAFQISTERTAIHFPDAASAIRRSTSGKYLGLVTRSTVIELCSPRHEVTINLIGFTPPTRSFLEDSSELNPMHLPGGATLGAFNCQIEPVDWGPSVEKKGRVIRSDPAFPWNNAYLYTTVDIKGIVGDVHSAADEKGSAPCCLPKEEYERFGQYVREDKKKTLSGLVETWETGDFRPGYPKVHAVKHGGAPSEAEVDPKSGTEISPDKLVLDIWTDLTDLRELSVATLDARHLWKEWKSLNDATWPCYWQDYRNMDDVGEDVRSARSKSISRLFTLPALFEKTWSLGMAALLEYISWSTSALSFGAAGRFALEDLPHFTV